MANVTAIQTYVDGDRNVVVKATGVLDTSNVAKATLVDVSALVPAVDRLALRKVWFSVQAPLAVNLYWDATTDVQLVSLSGTGHFEMKEAPIPDNAGSARTGDVLYETTGWATGTWTYTLIAWFTKGTPL